MGKWGAIRKDFPMLEKTMHGNPLIYLDSAATAQKPKSVIHAMSSAYMEHYGTVHRAVYDLAIQSTEAYQKARETAQRFIGAASPDEIIFTRGTTSSINLVARSFARAFLREGDEVLITEMEHHANIVPWQMACQDRRAKLKVLPFSDDGTLRLDLLDQFIGPRTKIVSCVHMSNALGTINPVETIIQKAREVKAAVLVDGAQSAPSMPVDVQKMDADFFVFSGHKTYGPTGVGVLYGKKALLDSLPPDDGGGDMIQKVTFEKTTYNACPLKFEAGTPPIVPAIGLGAALDYISNIGMDAIAERKGQLLKLATELLSTIDGLRILGTAERKGAIISFIVEGIHPLDLATFLDLKGVAVRTGHHCAQPIMQHYSIEACTRASFSFYNMEEEVHEFSGKLQEVIGKIRRSL